MTRCVIQFALHLGTMPCDCPAATYRRALERIALEEASTKDLQQAIDHAALKGADNFSYEYDLELLYEELARRVSS